MKEGKEGGGKREREGGRKEGDRQRQRDRDIMQPHIGS